MRGSRGRARAEGSLAAAGATTARALGWGAVAAHAAGLGFRIGVALLGRGAPGAPAPAVPAPSPAPVFTVLGPLRDEAGRVGPWLDAVAALRYPRERLDVVLLLEPDDPATRRAAEREAARLGHPRWLRLLVVPPGGPRTKPRALNHGLAAAAGELLVVYDAEDLPDPDQLLAAAAGFAGHPAEVACLQARPVVAAPAGDRFGRLMAAEYRLWHGGFLPGLARLGAPLPLAGTSNHLRVEPLRRLGGWDPRNVTEDAELGLRLARAGLRTEVLASRTVEDATPPGVSAWLRQRSRWSKGYMQTWLGAVGRPGRLAAQLGAGRAACVHLTLAGTAAVQLATPLLWAAGAVWAARAAAGRRRRPTALELAGAASAVGGTLARLAALRALRGDAEGVGRAGLAAPLYWALEGVAAWRGLHGLIVAPERWDKTAHPPAPGPDVPARPGPSGRPARAAARGPRRSRPGWANIRGS